MTAMAGEEGAFFGKNCPFLPRTPSNPEKTLFRSVWQVPVFE